MSKWDEMTERERDAWVAERVFHRNTVRLSVGAPSTTFMLSGVTDDSHYTTDASADYLVLCKVREEWDGNQQEDFANNLEYLFGLTHWGEGNPIAYRPGDYSHAAYLALEGSDDA